MLNPPAPRQQRSSLTPRPTSKPLLSPVPGTPPRIYKQLPLPLRCAQGTQLSSQSSLVPSTPFCLQHPKPS